MCNTKEYHDYEIEDKQYPEGSIVLVFDLDTVIYPIASAQDHTSIIVHGRTENRSYKNRTEFKKVCKDNDWNYDIFTIEDSVTADPVHICYSVFDKVINKLIKDLNATHCEYYYGGSNNFRDDLELPVKYKDNRKEVRRPTQLKPLQTYAFNKYDVKKITGMETDDIVSIRSLTINKQKNVKAILITTDKDSLQSFPSENFVLKDEKIYHLNDPLGSLNLKLTGKDGKTKKITGTGLKWLISQTLILGDSTDEYLPRRHFNTQYGPVAWYNDVSEIKDVKEFLTFSCNKFKELVGNTNTYTDWQGNIQTKTWLELAELYWSCAYMKTKVNDNTCFEDILKKYDVEYKDQEKQTIVGIESGVELPY